MINDKIKYPRYNLINWWFLKMKLYQIDNKPPSGPVYLGQAHFLPEESLSLLALALKTSDNNGDDKPDEN